jgi:hypothetical protein
MVMPQGQGYYAESPINREIAQQGQTINQLAGAIQGIHERVDRVQGVYAPYGNIIPYDRKYDLRDTDGGGMDTKARSLRGRHASDKGFDVGELSKGAKELADERRRIYKERKEIIDKAIESGTLSSRELVDALEQLTALQKGLVETEEESKSLSAEVKYRKEYANMIGANFEDVFLVRLNKDGKPITKEEDWDGVEIDQQESARRIKQFITENTDKFGREEVLKAIEQSAWDFVKRYREMKVQTPYGIEKHAEEVAKKEGIDLDSEEFEELRKKIRLKSNHILKDHNERRALQAVSEAGIPAELRDGTGNIKDYKGEVVGLKEHRDHVQRTVWMKEAWRDGTPEEVSRLSRLLDWDSFMQYAIKEKFGRPDLQEKAKKMGITWLKRYWNMADRKGGFTFYWHDRKNDDKPRQNVGEEIHVKSQEDLLRLISESELPSDIKLEFRNMYADAIQKRDVFVEEFVNSPEYKFWFETTDHGIDIETVWKENIEPELDRYLNMGLINQRTKDKVEETFRWMAERGTKTEERGQNYHMLVQSTIRDMMDEERRKADLYNEELDLSNALNTDAILDKINKITTGKKGEDGKWHTDGPKGEANFYPPRSELGGADRQRLVERIVKSELEREQQVRRMKNELDRVDVNKPNSWDLFTAQFDQGVRVVGNVLKTFVFGHTPLEAMHAIRQNRDNIELLKLNYRDQLTAIDQRKRELQQAITNLQNEGSVEQALEQVTWHKEISKKGYMELKDNLDKERRSTFRGLAIREEWKDTQPVKQEIKPEK